MAHVAGHDFQKVARGLGLAYAGLTLIFGATIIGALAMGVLVAQDGNPVPISLAMVGAIWLAMLLGIVGKVFCLAVPAEVQARPTIATAVFFVALGLVITLAQQFVANPLLALGGSLSSAIGYIAFLTFLKRLAEFIGDDPQVKRAEGIFLGLIAVVALYVVGFMLSAFGGTRPIIIAGSLCLVAGAISALVLVVRYGNLLTYLRQSVTTYASAAQPE